VPQSRNTPSRALCNLHYPVHHASLEASAMPNDTTANPPHPVHHYRLYVSQGHVLARNTKSKTIDLGTVTEHDGLVGYRLDVGDLAGANFATTEKMLNDVAAKLAFAYLDDLFTALADCTPQIALDLDKDPYLDITLEDITPREGSSLNEPTPHIF
jgi:hypothetical protein